MEVYRSSVLHPSERALRARRHLRDAILHWSGADTGLTPTQRANELPAPIDQRSIGIKNAFKALNCAISARLKREINRLPLAASAKTTADKTATPRHAKVLAQKKAT